MKSTNSRNETHEKVRDNLQRLNREIMSLRADYDDLQCKLARLGEQLFELYNKVDAGLNSNERNQEWRQKPGTKA